jgi:hypothetical protein
MPKQYLPLLGAPIAVHRFFFFPTDNIFAFLNLTVHVDIKSLCFSPQFKDILWNEGSERSRSGV